MTHTLFDQPFAAAWGVFGMLCLITWPLFRRRTTMLVVQLGIAVGLGVHYGLLGAMTAALMNALCAIQVVAAIPIERQPRLRWTYYAVIPVIALASGLTWNGLPSAFAALGMLFLTLGRLQTNVLWLRAILLVSVPFWLTHDLLVGSLPAVIADIATFATGSVMLLRNHGPWLRWPSSRLAVAAPVRLRGWRPAA